MQYFQPIPKKELTALLFHKDELIVSKYEHINKKQMECKSGCELETINTIFCTSLGFDGKDNHWTCKPKEKMDVFHTLSNYNVTCEGFDNSTDSNVIVGSCSFTYEIKYAIEYIYLIETFLNCIAIPISLYAILYITTLRMKFLALCFICMPIVKLAFKAAIVLELL